MMRVDDDFMEEVGLAEMPAAEKQAFMDHAEEELEVRVGRKIGAGLDSEKLNEFLQLRQPSEAKDFLERNVPNYQAEVVRVFEDFKNELRAERMSILA